MAYVKLACSTITWTWGKDIETALKEISEVGYEGFETLALAAEPYFGNPKAFQEIFTSQGLNLASLWCSGDFTPNKIESESQQFEKTAHFLSKMHCKQFIVGGGKRVQTNTDQNYLPLTEALNRLGKSCGKLGIQLVYHPHWGTLVQNREELKKFCDMTDPNLVYLAPDTGHLYKGGMDCVEVFSTYIDRIKYVHFKDVRNNEFVELGQGQIDLQGVWKVLQESKYSGWIVAELDSTRRTPKESARMSMDYLRADLHIQEM